MTTNRPEMRILIVMPMSDLRGGAEFALLQLIEHGRDQGIKWHVAFFDEGPLVDAVRAFNVATFVVPAGRLRQPHRMVGAILRLRQIIRTSRIDEVLSWMGKGQLYGGPAAKLAGVPAVWFQHGLPRPVGWQDRLATALPARLILACSSATAAAQREIWPHRPVSVVYPGVDLARFDSNNLPSPAECRIQLGLPTGGPLIGMVGRLQRWKGMHYLVEAMRSISTRHPDANAVIVGGEHALEPDYPALLRGLIQEQCMGSCIHLAGLQEDIPRWMQAMDVIVHASDAEPFGMVVIEAMALGKPVIATRTAGPSEIILDSVNGLLWSAGNIEQLAEAVEQALDPSVALRLSSQSRARAADFSVERFARAVCEHVRSFFITDTHFETAALRTAETSPL